MRNAWDDFAEQNAEYYILTEDTDYLTEEGRKHFFKTGKEFTAETLDNVLQLLPSREKCLEIGCGIGRLTIPHSHIFKEVIAVDLSSVMLDKLNRNAIEFEKENIITFLPAEEWDTYAFDYAYSFIVFQHIEELGTIQNYIARISSSLKPNGIAQLHFDTRPQNILYKFRNLLPDIFLPKVQRSGIRRIRRTQEVLKNLFKEHALKIVEELNPESEQHIFILQKR